MTGYFYIHLAALGALPSPDQAAAWLLHRGWEEYDIIPDAKTRVFGKLSASLTGRETDISCFKPGSIGYVEVPMKPATLGWAREMMRCLSGVCRVEERAFWQVVPEMRDGVQVVGEASAGACRSGTCCTGLTL